MALAQLSVFMNDEVGRLAEATKWLGLERINVIAFCVAETVEFGIVRLIASDTARAVAVLREARFTVLEGPIAVARIMDEPGGLGRALGVLAGILVFYFKGHHRFRGTGRRARRESIHFSRNRHRRQH